MKHALQFVIVVSIAVSLAAMSGFAWMLLGYSVSGAFGSVLKTPEDPTAKVQLFLWGAYVMVSFVLTFWLVVIYRRQFKRQPK
jgi:glucan phosphoethanolaminetransferase (alkaline phosphatase superfamily)